MKKLLSILTLTLLVAACTAFAGETWKGTISDKMCGAEHHGGMDPVKCTLGCVKSGSPYVFVVAKDKILEIANQKDAKIAEALAKYAGKSVQVEGKLDGKNVTIETIKEAGK